MSFNGSGTFNINTAGQPVVTGTVISSSVFNALTADLATGLSTCITKDGQTTVTANIPMNSFKFTGLAAGTAATDSVRLGQLQAGAATLITVTGTNTYAGTMTPALSAYAAGNTFSFLVPNTNTTSCTLNIDGLGAKSITRDGTTALVAGDLVANSEVVVVYDGTQFQVLNSNSKTNFNLSGTLTVAGNTTLSGGTANGVAYLNGSKVLTTGSGFTYSSTGNLVLAAPSSGNGLSVSNVTGSQSISAITNVTGSSSEIPFAVTNAVDSNILFAINQVGAATKFANIYTSTSTPLLFGTSGTERIRIDSSGNVGIGTSSPGSKLQVNSTGVGVAKLVDTSATGYSGLTFAGTGTQNYAIGMGGPSEATFGVANKWFLYDGLAGAMRMVVDTSGNLGLGVTPSAWSTGKAFQFGVYGVAYDNNVGFVTIGSNFYYNAGDKYKATDVASKYVQGAGTHAWYTAPSGTAGTAISFTQAMTLDSSGNLLVGTTSASGRLTVRQDSTTASPLYIVNAAVSGKFASFEGNGAVQGSITWSGSTTAYNTTSDQRLKENITDADSASDLIDAIKVRQFDWKADGTHQRYGMIAQELHEVAPEAVYAPADPEDMMAVDYSKLVPMLIKEIQSLRQRVAQLEVK